MCIRQNNISINSVIICIYRRKRRQKRLLHNVKNITVTAMWCKLSNCKQHMIKEIKSYLLDLGEVKIVFFVCYINAVLFYPKLS